MVGKGGDRAVTRLRLAVLVGAAVGLAASSAVVGAVDVSVTTATVTVTNGGEQTRTITVVSERDGERIERTREVAPGETVRPVAFVENGEYHVKVYVEGRLCAHMSADVVGANLLSSGTVTTTGNSLIAACSTDIDTNAGPTVRAG